MIIDSPGHREVGIISLVVAVLAGAYLVLNQQTHLMDRVSDTPLTPAHDHVLRHAGRGERPGSQDGRHLQRSGPRSRRCPLFVHLFETPPRVVAQEPIMAVPDHRRSIRFATSALATNRPS